MSFLVGSQSVGFRCTNARLLALGPAPHSPPSPSPSLHSRYTQGTLKVNFWPSPSPSPRLHSGYTFGSVSAPSPGYTQGTLLGRLFPATQPSAPAAGYWFSFMLFNPSLESVAQFPGSSPQPQDTFLPVQPGSQGTLLVSAVS